MKKEFVTYEQALALKELDFDESCFAQYKKYEIGDAKLDIGFSKNEIVMQFHKLSNFCSAPLWQQAFKWFLEKYKLNAYISYSKSYDWQFIIDDIVLDDVVKEVLYFKTKEEAMLNCLDELIEIAEQFKKK